MRIAIEGCAHGELDLIYQTVTESATVDGKKVDLLLCCGDFQATRNEKDLACMAVPDKFKEMGSFYKYYSGEKKAPVLTIFIGGNHEASNYLQELAYGGWVAPNIYYLGYAGVVTIAGVRIAGISGIFKHHDLMKGHHEFPPYSDNTIRSAYHIRNLEIFRLKQLSGNIDVFMSHDWPLNITDYGNTEVLLRQKSFFKNDIANKSLGSPPLMELLKHHYPSHWFSAHLHCHYAALVPKEGDSKVTKFLALDKCLPYRKYLQIVEIEHDESLPLKLSYDLEWLTILFLTNHLLSVKNGMCYMPGPHHNFRCTFTPTEDEKEKIHHKLNYDLSIPLNFKQSIEPYIPGTSIERAQQPSLVINEQTTEFCNKLAIDDPFALLKIANGVSDENERSVNSSLSTSTPTASFSEQSFSTTEEDDSAQFVIDTTPTYTPRLMMSPLKLPAAKSDSTVCIDGEDSIKSNQTNSSKSTRSLDDMKEEVLPDSEEKKDPNCKKFKRRNQSIYTDTESTT